MMRDRMRDVGVVSHIKKDNNDIRIIFYDGHVCNYSGVIEGKNALVIAHWIIENFSDESK